MKYAKCIRIGTRESALALQQAYTVQTKLQEAGLQTTIIKISSAGDTNTITPLYEMGVQGIFTKALDSALLNNEIDVAVHSYKDVPTQAPVGISTAAVLARDFDDDVLVLNSNKFSDISQVQQFIHEIKNPSKNFTLKAIIASSSLRRKAQWLHFFPFTTFEDIRGNVQTRLQKLADSNWDGAIFSLAGLKRLDIRQTNAVSLSWMLPAPAQGVVCVQQRSIDEDLYHTINSILNDDETMKTTHIERQFLRTLEGGCTTPIGALSKWNNEKKIFHVQGNVLSVNGKEKVSVELTANENEWKTAGTALAQEAINQGAQKIIDGFKKDVAKS